MNTSRSVLVVGNCTVDLSFVVPRFPKPGETLLASERRVDLGGKGVNQAIVAHRSGAVTALAVPIGSDPDGDWAAERLVAEGLSPHAFLRTSTATDQSVLYITPDGENCIVSSHGAAVQATPHWAEEVVARAAVGSILLMQGNLRLETTATALAAARRRGITTVLNPAPIQYAYDALLPLADVVIVNRLECAEIGGESDSRLAARSILKRGAGQVIVTLGALGALAIDDEGETAVSAPAVAAIDTVGAGDVFCGVFAACLARNGTPRKAVPVSVEAAALAVTRRGTLASFPTAHEITELMNRNGYQR